MATVPAKVRASVEIRGGPDDYAEFYCATAAWDWGDDTVSEAGKDCEPYVAGRSTIERRFTIEHTYRQPGMYKISFRMKQKNKVVAQATTNVQIRPGLSGGV